LNKLNL